MLALIHVYMRTSITLSKECLLKLKEAKAEFKASSYSELIEKLLEEYKEKKAKEFINDLEEIRKNLDFEEIKRKIKKLRKTKWAEYY